MADTPSKPTIPIIFHDPSPHFPITGEPALDWVKEMDGCMVTMHSVYMAVLSRITEGVSDIDEAVHLERRSICKTSV